MNDYSMYDLADEFNTQLFIVRDKEKFNNLLIEEHFRQVEEMEELQQRIDKAIEYIEENMKLDEKYINLFGSVSEWEEEDIKSIVTKEQFESMNYKVQD